MTAKLVGPIRMGEIGGRASPGFVTSRAFPARKQRGGRGLGTGDKRPGAAERRGNRPESDRSPEPSEERRTD